MLTISSDAGSVCRSLCFSTYGGLEWALSPAMHLMCPTHLMQPIAAHRSIDSRTHSVIITHCFSVIITHCLAHLIPFPLAPPHRLRRSVTWSARPTTAVWDTEYEVPHGVAHLLPAPRRRNRDGPPYAARRDITRHAPALSAAACQPSTSVVVCSPSRTDMVCAVGSWRSICSLQLYLVVRRLAVFNLVVHRCSILCPVP